MLSKSSSHYDISHTFTRNDAVCAMINKYILVVSKGVIYLSYQKQRFHLNINLRSINQKIDHHFP